MATRVSACWEPLRDEDVVGVRRQPAGAEAGRRSPPAAAGSPSVVEYCSVRPGVPQRIVERAARSPSASKSSGAGRPPANEMTPGPLGQREDLAHREP